MKIQLSMASWNPSHGGPFFSVGNLARSLAEQAHRVSIFAANYPHAPMQEPPVGVELATVEGRIIPFIKQAYIPGARNSFQKHLKVFQPNVIHDNGLWLSLNHVVARGAEANRIPRLLSPRGTLDPWAFQYRNWKKRLAMALYQRKDLETVDCFHAASQLEAENIRNFGFKQPIAIIPNGVDIPEKPAHFNLGEQTRSHVSTLKFQTSGHDHARTALFIGRMHPIKNLPNLIKAWARTQPEGWRLKLVGTSEVGHRKELEKLAQDLGIGSQVVFSGPLYGDEKAELFREAQLLFLVSNSENFGLTAIEAMAAGLPVVTSMDTPWGFLEKKGLGWSREGTVESLVKAIEDATTQTPTQLRDIGHKARCLVSKNYNCAQVTEQFGEVY
ncbi:MAG: glycosyltransferase, partial [Coraliomargaritaceae bacterium]